MGRGVRQRGTRRLLHDVTELPRKDQRHIAHSADLHAVVGRAGTVQPSDSGFDEHDVSAHRRVVHPGGDTDLVLLVGVFRVHLRPAEQLPHFVGGDGEVGGLAGGQLPRHFAGDGADLPLELAYSALARVFRHDGHHRVVGEGDVLLREPGLLELARDQVLLGDLRLLALRVAGEVDDFHPVEQWGRNILDEVRGRDEEHLAQIERHAKVMVSEGVVLRRVEHLEQRRRGIALKRRPELVDFIE